MILQGRYELQELIGSGGSAVVFRGWDQRLERQCAIKIMTFHDLQQVGSCLRQIYREAELLKELRHPAIPAILDIVEMTWQTKDWPGGSENERNRLGESENEGNWLEKSENERNRLGESENERNRLGKTGEEKEPGIRVDDRKCYTLGLVMEMAEGLSLEDYILGEKTYSLQNLLDWSTQICDVLIYLHGQCPPVIYRDMKPGHVIIDDQGVVHLIDFGIARVYSRGRKRDTELLGTRGYAAPEQYGSGQTDCRTDIFGMGMTLWEALENCSESNEALYRKLRRIFCKCTAIDPKDRYQACQEVKAELDRCGTGGARRFYFLKNFTIHKGYVIAGILIILFFVFSGNIIVCGNAEFQKEIRYSQLIHFSESLSTEKKIENCKDAIRLDGGNLQAYMQLLDLYESGQCFDQGESAAFTGLIEKNRDQLQDQEAFPELLLRTGEMYIYLYSEDVDFQEKLFLAYPWFQEVRDTWPEAEGFARLAAFEKSYVVQGVAMTQPESKDYTEFLEAIRLCMQYLKDQGNQSSPAYSRLIIWDEFSRLLYSQAEGMLLCGISEKDICQLMEEVGESAGQEEVTRADCLNLQEKILTNVKKYVEKISAKAEAVGGE